MNREERIRKKLTEELSPESLQIKNNSHLHKGHLGDDGSSETHFAITISAAELKNLPKVKAHQKINNLLKSEFAQGLHALEIRIV